MFKAEQADGLRDKACLHLLRLGPQTAEAAACWRRRGGSVSGLCEDLQSRRPAAF